MDGAGVQSARPCEDHGVELESARMTAWPIADVFSTAMVQSGHRHSLKNCEVSKSTVKFAILEALGSVEFSVLNHYLPK